MALVTGAQIRAGRALLGWSRDELADAAEIHRNAVGYWEGRGPAAGPAAASSYALHHIARALRAAGIEFVCDPAPGVRFRTRAQAEAMPVN